MSTLTARFRRLTARFRRLGSEAEAAEPVCETCKGRRTVKTFCNDPNCAPAGARQRCHARSSGRKSTAAHLAPRPQMQRGPEAVKPRGRCRA